MAMDLRRQRGAGPISELLRPHRAIVPEDSRLEGPGADRERTAITDHSTAWLDSVRGAGRFVRDEISRLTST